MMKSMLLILLFIALTSCAPYKGTGSGLSSKIIGGSPVNTNNWITVVQLSLGYWGGSCTGTVIDNRTILTAAHCVAGTNPTHTRITVKNPKNLFKSKTYRVARGRVHPMYNNNTSLQNYDVAYLTLTEDFTESDGEFVPLVSEEELTFISPGTEITMVGFGKTENGSSGKKLETSTPIIALTYHEVIAGQEDANTCQGDSGGPAFVRLDDGQYRQLGITSRGEAGCRGAGIYEMTTTNLRWLKADKLLIQAFEFYQQEKYQEAIDTAAQSIQEFPVDKTAYLLIAKCAQKIEDSELQQQYADAATELQTFLEKRLTNYYLHLLHFEAQYPQNRINYNSKESISVDASPFGEEEEYFYLNIGDTQLKVSFTSLYQEIKEENIDYIYAYQTINHQVQVHFPTQFNQNAWPVISKIFNCNNMDNCPLILNANLRFSGRNKSFTLYDIEESSGDQLNLSWYLN